MDPARFSDVDTGATFNGNIFEMYCMLPAFLIGFSHSTRTLFIILPVNRNRIFITQSQQHPESLDFVHC